MTVAKKKMVVMHPLPRVNEIRSAASLYWLIPSSSYLLHFQIKVLLYPQKGVPTCIALLFFLQRGGWHRPKGSLLPSGRKRHVYPDGPAGHCSGQIDVCAAIEKLQHLQRFTSVDRHQVLKCLCCVLVTSIIMPFHCKFFHPRSGTVFYTATIKTIRLLVVSDLDMLQLL